jgi:sporulation protein YlmC with PRC-barrel domain
MRIRYHDLVGTPVYTADGQRLGRVADLTAEPRGDRLCIVALLVGSAALAHRAGLKRLPLIGAAPPRTVPWPDVAHIGDRIVLRVTADELAVAAREAAP